MTSKSAAELLDELIGPEGRLAIAYRQAAASGAAAGDQAWGPVHRILAEAVGVSSGMVAGRPEAPYSSQLGVLEPCGGCGQPTLMRVHSTPWHPSCWQRAGCPVRPAPVEASSEATAAEPEASAEHPENEAEKPAEAPQGPTEVQPPDQGDGAPYKRRKAQREAEESAAADDGSSAGDPTAELRKFSKELRDMEGFAEATDEECAAAMEAWHRHVQAQGRPFEFSGNAGHTGTMLYELLAAANGAMVQPEPLTSELAWQVHGGTTTVKRFSFVDSAAAPAAGEEHVTEVDVKAQYLAAGRSIYVGDGEPDLYTEPDQLREHMRTLIERPGYLELASAPDLSTVPWYSRRALADVDTGWWLPMPLAKYLAKDHGVALDPARALLWPRKRQGQRLRVWSAHVNDARLSLEQARADGQPGAAAALAVLKAMYATFLGGLLASEDHNHWGTLRPDWRDMVVSHASVNAWRAFDKAGGLDGARLVGSLKDAFWLVAPAAPARPKALVWADQPDTAPDTHQQAGKWKVERTCLVTQDIAKAVESGGAGKVARTIREAANQQGES